MSGQDRRRWLNERSQDVYEALRYYLGPAGAPWLDAAIAAAPMTDAGDIYEAQAGATDIGNARNGWEALEGTGRMLTGMAAAVAPVLGAKMANNLTEQGIDWLGSAVDDFMAGYDPTRVNIFAGVNAKTADLDALERAKGMADSGAARDDIWRDTGWFQGVDGKWRFEIDDSASSYVPDTDRATVSEVFTHDGLFEAYPDLANFSYARTDETNWRGERPFSGSYDDGSVTIHDDLGAKGGRRVMLHELQHGVQDIEGFSPGGNPSQFVADDLIPLIEEADAEEDRLLGLSWRAETPEEAARLRALSREAGRRKVELRKQAAEYRFDNYQRLAGEVEARSVEARRDLSAIGRSENPPFLSGDVAPENQIVRRGRDASGVRQSVEADGALDPAATRGQEILDLLSTNPSAVTDDMLDMGDPVLNARLNEYLWNNYDLPMDEASRMARAERMGFHDADLYHATPNDFQGFDLNASGMNTTVGDQERAAFLSDRPEGAASFINRGYVADFQPFDGLNTLDDARARYFEIDKAQGERAAKEWWASEVVPRSPTYLDYADGGNVIPARISTNNGFSAWDYYGRGYDSDQAVESILDAKEEGSDAVVWRNIVDGGFMGGHKKQNVVAHFDPTQIRSRFARFDPRLAHLRNLNAGLAGIMMGGMALTPSDEAELETYLGGI